MKQKLAILVHGYNVTKPGQTIGKLKPYLERCGYKVVMFNYGHTTLLEVRRFNKRYAKRLAEVCWNYANVGYDVHVFSHSNGSAITQLAAKHFKAPVRGAICINPALKRDVNPVPYADFVQVYHNDDDRVVTLGKWLRWLTPLARAARLGAKWGGMATRVAMRMLRILIRSMISRWWQRVTLGCFVIQRFGFTGQ